MRTAFKLIMNGAHGAPYKRNVIAGKRPSFAVAFYGGWTADEAISA
jgi:hypothetical protein